MERISYIDVPDDIFKNLRAIEDTLSASSLDKKLLTMIKLRTSQKNGCAYCVDMHHKELKHLGETDLRMSSLCVWEDTPYFTKKERAVLYFTDALTKLSHSPISEKTYNRLLDFFSKQDICYLTLAVAQSNTWNRLMKTFGFIPGNYEVK